MSKTKQKKLSMIAIASAIALGAVAPTVATLQAEEVHAASWTKSLKARSNHIMFSSPGKVKGFMGKGQWYTVDVNQKPVKKYGVEYMKISYMDKTKYITHDSFWGDWFAKG